MGTRALYAFSDFDLELDNAAFFYSNGGSSGATCRNNFDGGRGATASMRKPDKPQCRLPVYRRNRPLQSKPS